MKALLLNSGTGSRMGSITQNVPKCMCPIGDGYTILSWQLKLLQDCGCEQVIITTGPFSKSLEEYARDIAGAMDIIFVKNPRYAQTNYIYSMELASFLVDGCILLLHGDLVLEASVLYDLINAPNSVVAIDSTLLLPKKDFKARIKDDRIMEIGISCFGADCVACQPAYKWQYKDVAQWLQEIHRFCLNGDEKQYAETALNEILSSISLFPLELAGRLCHEIDNQEDLSLVSARFKNCLLEGGKSV